MKNFLILVFILSASVVCAQFQIGSVNATSHNPTPILAENLEDIGDDRTIFVYRDSDFENLDDFKSALSSVWTINEMVFMSYDDFSNYKVQNGECYFTISANMRIIYGEGGSVSYLADFALSLWRYMNEKAVYFSYTQLYVPLEVNIMLMRESLEDSKAIQKLYKSIEVRNWNLAFLKATLKDLSLSLKEDAKRSCSAYIKDSELANLKNETLYISDEVLIKLYRLRKVEKRSIKEESLRKGYDYPMEFTNTAKIDSKVVNGEKAYCLSMIRNSLNKFIVVYEASSGKIVYSKMEKGFSFSKDDLKDLQKAIEGE